MLIEKRKRALICYAGSAPEASIGSKPIGSELKAHIGAKLLRSQESYTPNFRNAKLIRAGGSVQSIVYINYYIFPLASGDQL
jgi:hypothetical protein